MTLAVLPPTPASPSVQLLVSRDSWGCCKDRIRASVGDESFEAWFTSLRLVDISGQTVRLSVIKVFLKQWIIGLYSEALIAACKAEWPQITKVQLGVRTCAVRNMQTPPVLALPAPLKQLHSDKKPGPYTSEAWRYAGLLPRYLFPGHPDMYGNRVPLRIGDIQRVVARHYNLSRQDLISSKRTASVVLARQVAMYLAKALTGRSLPEIGRRFGGRDHTTVLHAIDKISWAIGEGRDKPSTRRINTLVEVDVKLKEEIELLKKQLQD